MKYFTVAELIFSNTAVEHKVDNTPSDTAVENLTKLVNRVLDPARAQLGTPIKVTSGYRSPIVNRLVGGAAHSYHMTGRAADLTTGSPSGNRKLYDILHKLPHCELIWERNGRWIHVAL
jgi:uncharacterized protein YcbK (DUF882 family)